MSANKLDTGKQQWHLILTYLPEDALHEVARVMEFGAVKYGYNNWENGMNWSRYLDAAMRHIVKWWRCKLAGGSEHDDESGLHHLAHAACDVLFLLAYVLRGIANDNRPVADVAKPVELPAVADAKPAARAPGGHDWIDHLQRYPG